MATISSLGIGSGLDLSGLLDDLRTAENEKLTPIVTQQKSYKTKLSAFGTLESSLTALRDAVGKLSDPKTFTAVTSSMTGDGVTANISGDAVSGRYQVNVSQLAQAQSLASGGLTTDKTEALGKSGTLGLSVGGNESVDISIGSDDSLEDIRDAINKADTGATASIVFNGSQYQLTLTSAETGTQSSIQVTDNDDLFGFSETVPAQDAKLEVNGISITSQSNTVEGALEGVTFNLTSTTESAQTLSVSKDTESMTKAVNDFVAAYNSFQDTADTLTSYDSDSDTAGVLLGNSTMRSIESRLRGVLSYSGGEGEFSMLSDLGIERQLDGTLKVDDDKLADVMSNNSEAVSQFFAGIEGEGGFAASVDDTMGTILDDDGLLKIATDGIDTSLERLSDRYTRMQTSIDATVARYRSQFAGLDSLVSQMNSTSDYLTQQFNALNAQLNQ
ncbi:flagellar filament capping protein FliD [Salinicola acroporae]|uniref:Flagellar hook-associated protein 2 n=1 Tax=Salinicola acroporae TaxID=1541440 RepID=A0ABT6I6H4_9GAMM|nr:flagellar filament capping protein FliD [Salinicola acroporae]MDH4573332.1 flagellar filament capping protein FliD [Salinicola acroporae]